MILGRSAPAGPEQQAQDQSAPPALDRDLHRKESPKIYQMKIQIECQTRMSELIPNRMPEYNVKAKMILPI